MTTKKKTMYEILEVSPTATLPEIKAAHRRLSVKVMSAAEEGNRADIDYQLNVLDVALHTLSVPVLRDEYDAKLAWASGTGNAVVPATASYLPSLDVARANELVAEIESHHKSAVTMLDSNHFPLKEVATTVRISANSLKTILRVTISLMILGFVLKMGQLAIASRQGAVPSAEAAKAEEKLIIQEYYKKYGVRPASRAEAELLEQEHARKENEQRQAEFAAKKKEEDERRYVEESRRMAERVSDNLARDEERARQEELRKQREEEYARRAAEAEENRRIERVRRQMGLENNNSNNDYNNNYNDGD